MHVHRVSCVFVCFCVQAALLCGCLLGLPHVSASVYMYGVCVGEVKKHHFYGSEE